MTLTWPPAVSPDARRQVIGAERRHYALRSKALISPELPNNPALCSSVSMPFRAPRSVNRLTSGGPRSSPTTRTACRRRSAVRPSAATRSRPGARSAIESGESTRRHRSGARPAASSTRSPSTGTAAPPGATEEPRTPATDCSRGPSPDRASGPSPALSCQWHGIKRRAAVAIVLTRPARRTTREDERGA